MDFGHHYPVIVVGDFNFPGIQCIEGSGFASSGDDYSFANLLMDFYLFQSVEQPTRGNNILDLVLTNTPSFMFEPKTGPQFRDSGLSSDHFPVFFDFAADVNFKDISRPKRLDFEKAKFESLKQVLLLTPLSNGIHIVNSIVNSILFGILCGMTLFLLL